MHNTDIYEKTLIGPYIHTKEVCNICNQELKYIVRLVNDDMKYSIFKIGIISDFRLRRFYKKCEAQHVA
jgi:hypothetical protein